MAAVSLDLHNDDAAYSGALLATVSSGGDCPRAEGRGQRCTGGALNNFQRGYFNVHRGMLLRSYGDNPRVAGAQGDEVAWVFRSKPVAGEA